jgi:ABC-type dipeptide/oligopeptide/nickel transport system permease component
MASSLGASHQPDRLILFSQHAMRVRIPFTFNTMVLLPFLRSLPPAMGISVVMLLAAMTGLDFGVLGLGRPDTAADELVALMMAFSIASPILWAVYLLFNLFNWAAGFIASRSSRESGSSPE